MGVTTGNTVFMKVSHAWGLAGRRSSERTPLPGRPTGGAARHARGAWSGRRPARDSAGSFARQEDPRRRNQKLIDCHRDRGQTGPDGLRAWKVQNGARPAGGGHTLRCGCRETTGRACNPHVKAGQVDLLARWPAHEAIVPWQRQPPCGPSGWVVTHVESSRRPTFKNGPATMGPSGSSCQPLPV